MCSSTRELVVASGYALWDAPLWEGSASGEVGIKFLPHWHPTCPFTAVDLFSHPPQATRVRLPVGREASGPEVVGSLLANDVPIHVSHFYVSRKRDVEGSVLPVSTCKAGGPRVCQCERLDVTGRRDVGES